MQIATDPVPLLHDRVLGSLLMQSCIVDRDARVEGEQLDKPLIVRGELGSAGLVGQVEVSDGPAARSDRDPEERRHRRVVRRKAGAAGVSRDVRDPVRASLADDQP